MPYAVVLYFNKHSEKFIQDIWSDLSNHGVPSEIHHVGIRPHITLGIYDELTCQPCDSELSRFAPQTAHLHLSFTHLGFFTHPEKVLFLAPTPTSELLDFHARIHQLLNRQTQGPWDLYQPGRWVPHCTLALDLDQDTLEKATQLCSQLELPVEMHATQIGVVEFLPVTEMYHFDLKGS
jgi:2'-5' RNA ligase